MEAFVVASDLPKSPGHPFYTALNRLLAENGFDPLVEKLCVPYYAETMGRPGVSARQPSQAAAIAQLLTSTGKTVGILNPPCQGSRYFRHDRRKLTSFPGGLQEMFHAVESHDRGVRYRACGHRMPATHVREEGPGPARSRVSLLQA
jgi:hypothetical protein